VEYEQRISMEMSVALKYTKIILREFRMPYNFLSWPKSNMEWRYTRNMWQKF